MNELSPPPPHNLICRTVAPPPPPGTEGEEMRGEGRRRGEGEEDSLFSPLDLNFFLKWRIRGRGIREAGNPCWY